MTWRLGLWLACIATEVGALVAALATSSRAGNFPRSWQQIASFPRRVATSSSAPIVALLACALAIDLILGFTDPLDRSAWGYGLNAFAASGPRPRTPLVRLAYHLADGLAMAWPLAVAWASGRVFSEPQKQNGSERSEPSSVHALSFRLQARPIANERYMRSVIGSVNGSARTHATDLLAGLFLGLVIGMAASYPLRPGLTRWLLWAWEAVCVAAAWAGVARGWPGRGGAVETAAIVLVACETMVCTCGPFLTDPFTRWWIAAAFYLVAFAGVGVVLGRARRPGVS